MRAHYSSHVIDTVLTREEFDALTTHARPELLEYAIGHTRRLLREIGLWVDDNSHEKLAIRWGYEFFEQFRAVGRHALPSRPFLVLEYLIAEHFGRAQPLWMHELGLSLLGRFMDGLASRAMVSRDALMALFYHLYGFGPAQVVRLLGLDPAESQRVYKNFERWRRIGCQRMITEIGFCDEELTQLEEKKVREPEKFAAEAERLSTSLLNHYRKSEPDYFPCLSPDRWLELFQQDCGYDYRAWHLALCHQCLLGVCRFRLNSQETAQTLRLDLHVRPPANKISGFVVRRNA